MLDDLQGQEEGGDVILGTHARLPLQFECLDNLPQVTVNLPVQVLLGEGVLIDLGASDQVLERKVPGILVLGDGGHFFKIFRKCISCVCLGKKES